MQKKTSYINESYFKYRVHINSITKSLNIYHLFVYLIIYCENQKLMENYNIKNELK